MKIVHTVGQATNKGGEVQTGIDGHITDLNTHWLCETLVIFAFVGRLTDKRPKHPSLAAFQEAKLINPIF